MSLSRFETATITSLLRGWGVFMRLSAVVTAVCLSIGGISAADDAGAAIRKFTNIPAQELDAALEALAQERDLQVVYLSGTIGSLKTEGAVGEFTADEVLERLLRGTGLSYRYLNEQTITIVAPGSPAQPATGKARAEDILSTPGRISVGSPKGDETQGSAVRFWDQFHLAQVEPASSSSQQTLPAASAGEVDEVTITAKRRATTATKFDLKVLDTPQSIKAVTRDVLDFASVRDFNDLTKIDASTNANGVYGGVPLFTMRGFDNSTDNGVKIDGIPALRALPIDFGVFERIEILKGPTSTLYGQNAVGGLLNAVSKKPLSDFRASLNVQGGSWDFRRIEGDVGGPVARDAALTFRTYGAYQEGGEFVDFTRNDSRVAYGALQYDFTEETSATFSANYQDRSYTPQYGISLGADLTVPDVPATRFFNLPWAHRDTDYLQTRLGISHSFSNEWKVSATAQYEHARAVGTDGAAFGLIGSDGFIAAGTGLPEIYGEWTSITQSQQAFEVSLTGAFDLFGRGNTFYLGADSRKRSRDYNYIGDLFMGALNIYQPDYSALAAPRPDLTDWLCDGCNDFTGILADRTEVSGITAQLLLHPTERLSLLAGGRLDKTKVTNNSWGASVAGGTLVKVEGTQTTGIIDTSQFISQAGVTFALRPGINLYANWGESFNPQSGLTFAGAPIDPERGSQYEVGVKAEVSNVTATLAVFDMKRTHIVGTDVLHPQFQAEIGAQKSKGVELDVFGDVLPGWSIYGSYAYIDGHITDTDSPVDVGARMFGVPRNALSLYSFYQLQNGFLKGLGFGGGIVSKQDIVWGLPSIPWLGGQQIDAGGYTTADARIYYGVARFMFDLKMNNVFDKKYYTQSSRGARDGVFAGRPREFIFGVKYSF